MNIMGNSNITGTSGFKPTMRVEIYDRFEEMKTGDTVKIGEVLSDGSKGELKVLNPRFRSELQELFTQPKSIMTNGTMGEDARSIDETPRTLAPWKPETLLYTTMYQLPIHNFRGSIDTMA